MNAHSVRKMKLCCLCGKIGIYKPKGVSSVPVVFCVHSDAVPRGQRGYAHPRCYIDEMGIPKLLTFPQEELGFIRLSDVEPNTMREILDRLHEKRAAI